MGVVKQLTEEQEILYEVKRAEHMAPITTLEEWGSIKKTEAEALLEAHSTQDWQDGLDEWTARRKLMERQQRQQDDYKQAQWRRRQAAVKNAAN